MRHAWKQAGDHQHERTEQHQGDSGLWAVDGRTILIIRPQVHQLNRAQVIKQADQGVDQQDGDDDNPANPAAFHGHDQEDFTHEPAEAWHAE